jgi:DNA-binding MarR family transcriptional regulator
MATECYCIALRAASRKLTAIYDAAMEPVGVGIAQFSLLRRIGRTQPVSLTELGRVAELDRSTVGRNVRVLERMGLVVLVPGEDQREATVSLAEPGRDVLQRGAPLWDATQERVERALGGDAAKHLRDLLQTI